MDLLAWIAACILRVSVAKREAFSYPKRVPKRVSQETRYNFEGAAEHVCCVRARAFCVARARATDIVVLRVQDFGMDCDVHSARERSETRNLFLSQARSQTRSQTRAEARFARNTLSIAFRYKNSFG